jgi:hypothetical protein
MVVEKEGSKTLEASAKADVLLGVEHSAFGTYGDPAAPRLWMIFDPYCSYSVRAFDELNPMWRRGASSSRSFRFRSWTTRRTARARRRPKRF